MMFKVPDLKFYNSTDRGDAVLEWARTLPWTSDAAEVFWHVIEEEWSSFDLIDHDGFADVFQYFMEWRAPRAAGIQLTVYRGQNATSPFGVSWTTDESIADGFARGHRGIMNQQPIVICGIVKSEYIAHEENNRGEAEVIVFRPDDVIVQSIRALKTN